MVVWVTVFLALTVGPQAVEVTVDGPVAEVEFLLDGEPMARAEHAPWRVWFDFGSNLKPRELEAVARDSGGRVIGRARQLVNFPRQRAETSIVLERDRFGRPSKARIVSSNARRKGIKQVRVTLDGAAVEVDRFGSVQLPRNLQRDFHVLAAEVTFNDGIVARSELTFGAYFGGETEAELTAVPMLLSSSDEPMPAEDLDRMLLFGDRPIEVAAVERTGVKILVINAAETGAGMNRFARQYRGFSSMGFRRAVVERTDIDRDQLIFAAPCARVSLTSRGEPAWLNLFPFYSPLDLTHRDLHTMLEFHRPAALDGCEQHIADAVAASAFAVARMATPRAVLLLLGDGLNDQSELAPEEVREFLASINVPLFVWHVADVPWPPRIGSVKLYDPPSQAVLRWRPERTVASHRELREAARDLMQQVRSQQIVWIEGSRLPSDLQIAEWATGIEFAR